MNNIIYSSNKIFLIVLISLVGVTYLKSENKDMDTMCAKDKLYSFGLVSDIHLSSLAPPIQINNSQ